MKRQPLLFGVTQNVFLRGKQQISPPEKHKQEKKTLETNEA